MSKLLPSQLTEEEILALLESEEVDEGTAQIFDYNGDIVPFLSFYNITPGHTPVSKKLLYKLYKAYSKEPTNQQTFNLHVGQFVAPSGRHFLLNTDNFAISHHIYEAEKTKDRTKSLSYQKHFTWFLEEKAISPGSKWIEGFILFFIYKDFCKTRRVAPKLGYVNFHKFLKLHFQYRRVKENRALFFKVDESTSKTYTEEDCEKIRAARTKKTGRGKKESKSEATETPSV